MHSTPLPSNQQSTSPPPVTPPADLKLYDRFNAAYRGYFGKEFPARGFIGSGPLLRGGHFEMQGIAVRR